MINEICQTASEQIFAELYFMPVERDVLMILVLPGGYDVRSSFPCEPELRSEVERNQRESWFDPEKQTHNSPS